MSDRIFSMPTRVKNVSILGFDGALNLYEGKADFENVTITSYMGEGGYVYCFGDSTFKNCKFKGLYGSSASNPSFADIPYNGGFNLYASPQRVTNIRFFDCVLDECFVRTNGGANKASDYPLLFERCELNKCVLLPDSRRNVFRDCHIIGFLTNTGQFYFEKCVVDGQDFYYGDWKDSRLNFSGFPKYIKDTIWFAKQAYFAGYIGNPNFVADNSVVKMERVRGTSNTSASANKFNNSRVISNLAQTQFTLNNSIHQDAKDIYYGVATSLTINQANVVGLGNSAYWVAFGNVTVNAGTDEYVYIAIPASHGDAKCTAHPLTLAGKFDFVDEFGAEKYNVYKTTEASLGSVTLTIEADV